VSPTPPDSTTGAGDTDDDGPDALTLLGELAQLPEDSPRRAELREQLVHQHNLHLFNMSKTKLIQK